MKGRILSSIIFRLPSSLTRVQIKSLQIHKAWYLSIQSRLLLSPTFQQPVREYGCHFHTCSFKLKDKKEGKGKKRNSPSGDSKNVIDELSLSDEVNEIINVEEMMTDFERALEHLQNDFVQNLSLRTSTASFHNIQVRLSPVEKCLLGEIGTIFMKTPTLCVINLVDSEHNPHVMEALQSSALNLNPQTDGATLISLNIPKVSREQREEMSKSAKVLFNKNKEHLRSIHNNYDKKVRKQKEHHSIDTLTNLGHNIQKIYESYVYKAENMLKNKQAELLQS